MHRSPLGQHFLRDPQIIQTILKASMIQKDDCVLEIGPGNGVLTYSLADKAKRLVAIELDASLAEKLRERLAPRPHCRVIQGDFLKSDLTALFPEALEKPIKLAGNLPYAITALIFEKILAWPFWECGVFLVQQEVGERMRSGPGSKAFGILSLAIQVFAEVERVCGVKPGAFSPPPRVHSMVVRLRRKVRPELPAEAIPAFFDLAHAAFSHRRKTLLNSLALYAQRPKKDVAAWLAAQGLDQNQRAETVAVTDYARLASAWSLFRREMNLT